jgi:hypothetical protein
VIVEYDLVSTLRGISDSQRGWQANKTSVKCQSCQAISVFDPERVGQRCDFCGSSSLVPYEEIKEAFRPESLLPMKISETQVRESMCGVLRFVLPLTLKSPQPWSSERMTTTFGGAAVVDSPTAITSSQTKGT